MPQNPFSQQWAIRELSAFSLGEQLSSGDIDRDGDPDLLLGSHWLQNNTAPDSSWADANRRYRVPFTVSAAGFARLNTPAELAIDFTDLLSQLGISGSLNLDALRVTEVAGDSSVLNDNVPFQFDPADGFDPANNAAGNLVVLLEGSSAAGSERSFHLYFDVVGGPTVSPMSVANHVALTDDVTDAGQTSYQVVTDSATYFYHKDGGGFSSLLDNNANDWINHSDSTGSAGDFRGIPNLAHPDDGGHFHPGRDTVISSIVNEGPLKATITSSTADNAWETMWEIYPTFARLTVLNAATNYWFLYEGTPGGLLEPASDFIVRSNGTQTLASAAWNGDLTGGEWLYFSDPNVNRSLFFAHHTDDALVDSYYPMNGEMTVFGFGRQNANRFLTETPNQFTMGFVDGTAVANVGPVVQAAYQPLAALLGTPVANSQTSSWANHALFATSEFPDRNRLGDINGDGRLDAIIGYETVNVPGKVAWYEQPADATSLWTEHIIANIIGPMSVDIGDMDRDGDLDVIIGEHNYANEAASRLLVYENPDSANGTWVQHIVYTGDEHHDGAQLVDIDNDDDFDAISIGWRHNRVLLYQNTGTCANTVATPTVTNTPLPGPTNTPEVTATNTTEPTATNTPEPGATNTPVPPTATNTAAATATNTLIPATVTNTAVPTATNTAVPSPTPDSSGCTLNPNNVLANPGFEDGINPWNFYTNGRGDISLAGPAFQCDNAARLSFEKTGSNMQLYQTDFLLKANTQYRLSFAAYSNTGHDLRLYLQRHSSPYTSYGLNNETFNLTSSWQQFSTEFTTSGFSGTTTDSRLRFWFVGKAANGDVYWIDNVQLEEVNGAAPTATSTPASTSTNTPVPPTAAATLAATATNTPVITATNTAVSTTTNTPRPAQPTPQCRQRPTGYGHSTATNTPCRLRPPTPPCPHPRPTAAAAPSTPTTSWPTPALRTASIPGTSTPTAVATSPSPDLPSSVTMPRASTLKGPAATCSSTRRASC